MIPPDLAFTTLPGVLSVVLSLCTVYVLVQCVCGKKKGSTNGSVELRDVTSKHNSTALSDIVQQPPLTDTTGIHLEVETAVTPLNTSLHSQNGTLHSRGNSVDLNKTDRHSAASAGSSPRPNTKSRELPDIPISKSQPHSHLPELPQNGRVSSSTLDGHYRGHAQLPEIPFNVRGNTLAGLETHRGGHSILPELPFNHPSVLDNSKGSNHSSSSLTSNNGARPKVVSPGSSSVSNEKSPTDSMDDYDHINETKRKNRPRSDYDHVIIDGDTNRIIPAKPRLDDDNDYAEVKNENIYEGVPELVSVISVSKPNITSIKVGASPKKESPPVKLHKVDSINDPYNRIKGDDPPYNKIVEDPYNKIKVDDPYNRVKVDDPYNRVKDDDPYNKVKDTDIDGIDDLDPYDDPDSTGNRTVVKRSEPAIKLLDDPYTFVIDEERNVSNQTDPYARVGDTEIEIDDPYNKVNDDNESSMITSYIPKEIEDDYSTVKKEIDVEYAKVNKNLTRENQSATNDNQRDTNDPTNIPSTSRATGRAMDEYATVQKVRKFSEQETFSINPEPLAADRARNTNAGLEDQARIANDPRTPPEPPRGYADDPPPDGDHYNLLAASMAPRAEENESTENQTYPPPVSEKKREPPYNKLSVRESLASMNARLANNPYEYVSEVDNLYATVDGSSGDGVVKRKSTANTEQRESTASEYYVEIEGAVSAPAPPSLDSLHETAKHHFEERRKVDYPGDIEYYEIEENVTGQVIQGHKRTPSGQGHQRTPSGHDHSIVVVHGTPPGQGHVRTPSGGAVMTSSYEGPVPVIMGPQNHASMSHNYQDMVEDEKMSDVDTNSEFDPNYETVEEAKSKVKYEEINRGRDAIPKVRNHIYEEADSKRKYEVINGAKPNSNTKIRSHVYEEVTVTNEARRVKQRVLSQHTYEEVTDVKGQSANVKQNSDKEKVNDVQKRKKGHERTSSGDQSWFGKRRSGEMKEKPKDSKKKSDGKDKENKKSGDKSSRL